MPCRFRLAGRLCDLGLSWPSCHRSRRGGLGRWWSKGVDLGLKRWRYDSMVRSLCDVRLTRWWHVIGGCYVL